MTMKRTILALTLAGGLAALACARDGAQEHEVPPPQAEMVVRRAVRQIRRGAAAARLQDLQAKSARTAIRCSCWRSAISPSRRPRLLGSAGRGGRGRIQDQGPRRQGPADRARRPAGRSFPVAVSRTSSRPRRRTASRRPICRRSPRRAPTARLPLVRVRHVHAVSGAGPGLHRRASQGLRGRRRKASSCRRAATTTIFPRPHHRHAAAAAGRAGDLRRRLAADPRAVFQGRRRPS